MEPEDVTPLGGATTRRDLLRKAGVVGATLAGGSLLAACGGSGSSGSTSASGPVTIDFWDEPWGGEDYVPTVKKMIAMYERANPGVTVKYRAVPWANFYEVYNTAIASGSTPDVAIAPTFPWRGSLASLDSVTDDWRKKGTLDDYIPAAIENQRDADGVLTGLPWGIDIRVINYRRDILRASDVAPPTSLDEIGAAARAVTRGGTYGLGFCGDVLGGQMLYSLFLTNGGGLYDAQCGPGLASDRNAEVCEWLQGLVRDGAIPKAAAGWTQDDLNSAMDGGDIAMSYNAPGWFSQVDPKVGKNLDLLSPPTGFHGDRGTLIYYNPLWVFKASEHQEQAARFVEWWLDNIDVLYNDGSIAFLPVRRSLYRQVKALDDPRYQKALDEWVAVAQTFGGECSSEVIYNLAAVEGQTFLQTLTQDILTLKPVDKSLQTAQDALAQALQPA